MSIDITTTPEWAALLSVPRPPHLRGLLSSDTGRAQRYVLHVGDLRVDNAKQRIDDTVMAALLAVADAAGVAARRVRCSTVSRSTSPRAPCAARRAACPRGCRHPGRRSQVCRMSTPC